HQTLFAKAGGEQQPATGQGQEQGQAIHHLGGVVGKQVPEVLQGHENTSNAPITGKPAPGAGETSRMPPRRAFGGAPKAGDPQGPSGGAAGGSLLESGWL